jgi:hypothetical protein
MKNIDLMFKKYGWKLIENKNRYIIMFGKGNFTIKYYIINCNMSVEEKIIRKIPTWTTYHEVDNYRKLEEILKTL